MKLLTHFQFLILAPILFWQCASVNAQKTPPVNSDKSNFAVIEFEPARDNFLFKTAQPAELSDGETARIEKTISEAVAEHNAKNKDYGRIKNLTEYKFQFVPVALESGEKHVWINAFCDGFGKNWKTEIIFVEDGGSCFFNLKINMKTSAPYDFSVNGEA